MDKMTYEEKLSLVATKERNKMLMGNLFKRRNEEKVDYLLKKYKLLEVSPTPVPSPQGGGKRARPPRPQAHVLILFLTAGTSFAISGSDLLHEGRAREASQDVGAGTVLREGDTHALPTGGQSHPAPGDGPPKKAVRERPTGSCFYLTIEPERLSRDPSILLQAWADPALSPLALAL